MGFKHIPENTVTIPSSRPVFLKGGDEAVLLIHGYNSYPEAMRYLGEELNAAGFTVSIPRLPGHGTNHMDFIQTTWQDWLRRCIDEYIELNSVHEKVHVAGHSMGGLITIILASIFKPEKIALYAPALIAKNKLLPFSPLIKLFLPKLERKINGPLAELPGDGILDDEQYMRKEYWSWYLAHPISQMYLLQRQARKVLIKVPSDVLIFVGKGDTKVSSRVVPLIKKKIQSQAKVVVLDRSKHEITHGPEKERVAGETMRWFKS